MIPVKTTQVTRISTKVSWEVPVGSEAHKRAIAKPQEYEIGKKGKVEGPDNTPA
jgi:hypothetical protein